MPLHSRKPARRLPPDRRGVARTCRRRPRQSPLPHLLVPDLTGWRCRCRIGLLQRGGGCRRKGRDRLRTGKAFEKQGYMTETVRALCAWAKQQPGVRHITAETEPDTAPRIASCKGPGSIPPKRTQLDGGACETRLPPGKYRRPFLRTAFCIFVDPEASIRNSGFPGSGADSWREKLFPTTGRLPQSHSSIPLSVFFIRSWSRKSLRSS